MNVCVRMAIACVFALGPYTLTCSPVGRLTEAVAEPQVGTCFSHYQRDGTIYVRNDCGYTVYYVACVTPAGSSYTYGTPMRGITEGEDDFTPATWPAAYQYSILTTSNVVGWQPKC